jgi:hypothetical protein
MAYDEDASYLGSSQGTPKNYGPSNIDMKGYTRLSGAESDPAYPAYKASIAPPPEAAAPAPAPVASYRAAMDPDNPGGGQPVDQPQSRGVPSWWDKPVTDTMRDISSHQWFGGPTQNAVSQLGVNISGPRTGEDRSAGAGYNDTQSVTVPAGGRVKPAMTFPTDPDANLPTAPVQPYGQVVQAANQAMANNYSDRLAAEDARRPNSQELESAKNDARIARFRATDGADMILGSNRLYGAQRAAIVQNAVDATANATRLDNLARGASQVTPPNLVQGAVAQTEADQKARSGSFDQQKGSVAVAGGKQALQKGAQELTASGLQLHTAQHLADLQKRALSGDTKANDMLALYQKAQSGKGGPITEEDKLKLYDDMVSRAVAMGGPEAYKSLPDFQTLSAHMDGRATPPPADWMARAKAANPGMSDEELTANYAKKAR